MQKHPTFFSLLSMITLLVSAVVAQEPMKKAREISVGLAGSGNPVTGSGTTGRISKWTGVFGSNTFTLGDSNIFEDKFGKIGIGTTAPTSLLTVQGMIETTLGGYKFPDGSVQTTAAVTGTIGVIHDATLTGDGTTGNPLGVAVPLSLRGSTSSVGVIVAFNTSTGAGVVGESNFGDAVVGTSTGSTGAGVVGQSSFGTGVRGQSLSNTGTGVEGQGGSSLNLPGGTGVQAKGGFSKDSFGGDGVSATGGSSTNNDGGTGVSAFGGDNIGSGSGGYGVFAAGGIGRGAGNVGGVAIVGFAGGGLNGASGGEAGVFSGDVRIVGDLNVVAGTKNFKIDHPLDPENKYLYHAAIESSEVLNVYSGNVRLDASGEATVRLPEWFEALNKDFRYSLTPIGAPGQGLYIAEEVSNNQFKIAGGLPGAKVSWQVTGIRSDAAMRRRPFKAEEAKPERERGSYLSPEAYDQPEERGVDWARNPKMMQQMKETRLKQIEESKQKGAKQ